MAALISFKVRYSTNTILCKNLFFNVLHFRLNNTLRYATSAKLVTDEIVIPKRIHREPTDILKALASTVPRNTASPPYKYEDDPYFVPSSNVDKRVFALALESGKKAAHLMIEKFPEHFIKDPAVPSVTAFNPATKYTEESIVTEDTLKQLILELDVENAKSVYENLLKQGVTLSQETQQAILELFCFTNGEPLPTNEYLEEKWYKFSHKVDIRKKWKENDVADQIFRNMENKGSREYSTMIEGLSKHNSEARAYALYLEMEEKSTPMTLGAFNSLLNCVPYVKESSETRWELLQSLLIKMANENIKPNLGTFNAILGVIAKFGMWTKAKPLALQTLAEMKSQNLEPSLATYYFILTTFCKERGPVSYILKDILKQIKGKEFSIQHPKDVDFFVTAMSVCTHHLCDIELAYQVHSIYMQGNNSKLIGDSFKESIYYQHFFKLLCTYEDIDTFFNFYENYVPNVYTPEPSIMLEIIQAIDLSGKYTYIPRAWSDVITFGMTFRENIVQEMLLVMAKSVTQVNEELRKQYAVITLDIKTRINEQDLTKVSHRINWNGEMLGHCLQIFSHGDKLEDALDTLKFLDKMQDSISVLPKSASLVELYDAALKYGQPEIAIDCVKFSVEHSLKDAVKFMQKNQDKHNWTELQRISIDSLLNAFNLTNESEAIQDK